MTLCHPMFKTREQGSPELRIKLHKLGSLFSPGDVLHGIVIRKAPIINPEDRVEISLNGRELCSMNYVWNDNSIPRRDSLFTREVLLIDHQKHHKIISQGSLYQPSNSCGQQSWSFTIAIPEAVDPKCGQQEDYEGIHQQTSILPPSFHAVHPELRREALVEYFIKASLITTNQEPTETLTAILPFKLQSTTPPPGTYYPASSHIIPSKFRKITPRSPPLSVASQRLAHDSQDISLSLFQKAQKYLSPSSVPRLGIQVWAGSRTLIDPSVSEPISFYVAIMPDWMNSSKSVRRVQRKAVLINFDIKLEATVGILCKIEGGIWPPNYSSWNISTSTLTFTSKNPQSIANRVEIPCIEEAEPVDIGKAIDLRLNQQDNYPVPSIESFYIFFRYFSHWTLEIEILGERVKVQGSQPQIVSQKRS